jgi:hypothetical protein
VIDLFGDIPQRWKQAESLSSSQKSRSPNSRRLLAYLTRMGTVILIPALLLLVLTIKICLYSGFYRTRIWFCKDCIVFQIPNSYPYKAAVIDRDILFFGTTLPDSVRVNHNLF